MSAAWQHSLCMQGGGRMKPYRGVLLASAILLAALPPAGCSNSLDGGSGPSGSIMRVVSVDPNVFEPDIYLSVCTIQIYVMITRCGIIADFDYSSHVISKLHVTKCELL